MKFLHISDIHFNPDDDGRATRDLRKKFLQYALEKEIIDIDEIFFTGDFRHALKQKDQPIEDVAQNTVNFLRAIASCVGVSDDSHIHIVPGNHDLSREVDAKTNSNILRSVYKNYDKHNGRFAGYVNKNKPSLAYLRDRFAFFKRCAELLNNKVWADFENGQIHRVVSFEGCDAYSIVYLNTAIASGYDKFKHNLLIGTDDFEKALQQVSGRMVIVLAHNPLFHLALEEQNIIRNIIKDINTPILWLCGDAHKAQYDKSYDIVCVTTGCMIQENGTEASFVIGELSEFGSLTMEAHGYAAEHGYWQPEEALSKRIKESIPKAFRPALSGDLADINNSIERNSYFTGKYNDLQDVNESLRQNNLNGVEDTKNIDSLRKQSLAVYNAHMKHQRFYMNRLIDERILPDFIVALRDEDGKPMNFDDMLKYLRIRDINCVQIVGEGGTGKTTSLLKTWKICCDTNNPIAFYIPLYEINDTFDENSSINNLSYNWLCSYLHEKYFKSLRIVYNEMISAFSTFNCKGREYVFLLDGFNEISQKNKIKVVKEIQLAAKNFLNVVLILTTRHIVDNDFRDLGFTRINLAPLSQEQVTKYLNSKNITVLKEDNKLQTLLTNPMMLTIYCSTCDILNCCSVNAPFLFRIPFNTKGELIANHIESLLFKHWITFPVEESELNLLLERWIFYFILTKVAYKMSIDQAVILPDEELWEIIVEVYNITEKNQDWISNWFFKYGHRDFPEILEKALYDKNCVKKSCEVQRYLETQFSLFLLGNEKKKTWRFWHQDYRDCLAATYILNELMFADFNDIFPTVLDRTYSADIERFLGELQLYSKRS